MAKTLWTIDKEDGDPRKLVIDEYGRLILCEECPCDNGDCVTAVDDKVLKYLSELDPDTHLQVWELSATYTSTFHCASWEYDAVNETWTLVSSASGGLLVALRYGDNVQHTAESSAVLLTYAKVLVNSGTGEHMTIGCQCRVRNYECQPKLVTLHDYDVAGSMPVWQPGPGDEYTPADVCRVDSCDLLKFKLAKAQLWHGGTMYNEGYHDWLLSPGYWEQANYRYQPFLMAVLWYTSAAGENVTWLDCECTTISTSTYGATDSIMEYPGICTMQNPCVSMMLLHNRAVANDWDWYDEGIIAHLATLGRSNGTVIAYGSWYGIREQILGSNYDYSESSPGYVKVMCCADTGTGYWAIGCGCSGLDFYEKDTPVEGYRKYFALPGVCACSPGSPDREILLAYPEDFGVTDIVWGNDNKFTWSYTTHEYNWQGDLLDTADHTGCSVCGRVYEENPGHSDRNMYIDYRAMCFIGKAFGLYDDDQGAERTWVRVIYPPGSPGIPDLDTFTYPGKDSYVSGSNYDIYETASFTNTQFTPFTNDMDIGKTVTHTNGSPTTSNYGQRFTGEPYVWSMDTGHIEPPYGVYFNGCEPTASTYTFDSEEEAKDEMGCNGNPPAPCIMTTGTGGHWWALTPLLTPDFTVTDHACQVTHTSGDNYTCRHRWITYGADAGTYNGNCYWLFLNVNYVCTNRGFIIKGLNDYRETYTLLNPRLHYPQYTWCWEDYDDEDEPQDTIIRCPADDDMHFCTTGFVIPDDEEDEEEIS